MNRGFIVGAVLATMSFALPATAQDHSDHQMPGMATQSDPAYAAYMAAMDKMHTEMAAVKPSGNADVDFARGMIPHHQAAIEMAQAQLQYGKDPEIRKLSEGIIAAQESEIKQLQEWLAKNAPN
jgi:uncharacterized protein (DUF305 family)